VQKGFDVSTLQQISVVFKHINHLSSQCTKEIAQVMMFTAYTSMY